MKKIIVITILLSLAILSISSVSAQLIDTTDLSQVTETVAQRGNLSTVPIGVLVARVVQTALGLLSIVFLILIISAGIRWMTAEGNEEQVAKARKTMKSAILGLIVVLAAYAITYFIFVNLPFAGSIDNGGVGGTGTSTSG